MLLEARDVRFSYGRRIALDGLSFSLPEGTTGLLGPNGAGKTTLVRLLLGHLPAPAGRLRMRGIDPAKDPLEIRSMVGVVPEGDILVPGLSAVSYVAYAGRLAGLHARAAMDRAHHVLHVVGLGADRYRRVEHYSKGMRQRLKLAQALVHDPPLLVLDEPTDGMDPGGRAEMLALLADLASRGGKSILLCTHLLDDVQRVCERALVIARGKAVGLVELKGSSGAPGTYAIRATGQVALLAAAATTLGARLEVDEQGEGLLRVAPERLDELVGLAVDCGVELRSLVATRDRLEDLFTRLVREGP